MYVYLGNLSILLLLLLNTWIGIKIQVIYYYCTVMKKRRQLIGKSSSLSSLGFYNTL